MNDKQKEQVNDKREWLIDEVYEMINDRQSVLNMQDINQLIEDLKTAREIIGKLNASRTLNELQAVNEKYGVCGDDVRHDND